MCLVFRWWSPPEGGKWNTCASTYIFFNNSK